MRFASQETQEPQPKSTRLLAYLPNGRHVHLEVCEHKGLVVGSSEGSGLRLEYPDVAPLHCVLSINQGELLLQDWYTKSGTFLNGSRITDAKVSPGDEIQVGPCRIVAQRGKFDELSPDSTASRNVESPAKAAAVQAETPASPSATVIAPAAPAIKPASVATNQAVRHVAVQPVAPMTPSFYTDAEKDELLELLRSEVEELQAKISERDERIAQLTELADSNQNSNKNSDAESAGLVQRLEELLGELERRDEREASLEELLRLAEQANSAEQEERRQLAAWVSDVETRIGEREAEWDLNTQTLRRQLEEVTTERDRSLAILSERSSPGADAAQQQLIVELQRKVDDLRSKLAQPEAHREGSVQHDESGTAADAPSRIQAEVDRILREERLKLAQERAELAAQRARLEFERRGTRGPDEADERARVLRQHLREIHERESQTKRAPPDTSLSARLSRLWKRLEG